MLGTYCVFCISFLHSSSEDFLIVGPYRGSVHSMQVCFWCASRLRSRWRGGRDAYTLFIVCWSHSGIGLICICRSALCVFAALHTALFALLHAPLSACTHKGPLASLLSLLDMFILLCCPWGGRGVWVSSSYSQRCAACRSHRHLLPLIVSAAWRCKNGLHLCCLNSTDHPR